MLCGVKYMLRSHSVEGAVSGFLHDGLVVTLIAPLRTSGKGGDARVVATPEIHVHSFSIPLRDDKLAAARPVESRSVVIGCVEVGPAS